ncbi:hypothetical protein PPO43_02975 [Saprospira sp. CCB-QB6]|uniref:hypothetical protein n=1 Tax=Saprospira sp. CCB-QB6 TaxID=3023936 RepID=UPI00234B78DB|nr:hypothetical protein [Saprospira sp. CCB-QB6]WCL82064.1 hypothetical protein PPO43_02975 [Saprospira sp. CCB-QB6]
MRNFLKILLRILPFLALLGLGFWIFLQFYGSREQESWFSSQYWGKENKAQRAAAQYFMQTYKDSLQSKNLSPAFLNWAKNYSQDSLQISALEAEEKLNIQLLQRHVQAQIIPKPSSVSFLQTPYYCPPDSTTLLAIEKQWLQKNTPDSIQKCLQALPICQKANPTEKNYFRQQLILLMGTDVQTELLFSLFQQELDSLYTQLAQLDSNSLNPNYWSQLQKQKGRLDSLPHWPANNVHSLFLPPFYSKNGQLGLQKLPKTIAWPNALLPLAPLLQKNTVQADSLILSPFQALPYPNLFELKAENKTEEKALLFAQIWQTKLLLAELGWYDQNWDIKQLKDFLKQNSPLPNYFQEQLILYLRSWPGQLLRPKLQNEILRELAYKMTKNNQTLNTKTFLQQYAALPLDLWEEALDLK